jgi:hypothetical protein
VVRLSLGKGGRTTHAKEEDGMGERDAGEREGAIPANTERLARYRFGLTLGGANVARNEPSFHTTMP